MLPTMMIADRPSETVREPPQLNVLLSKVLMGIGVSSQLKKTIITQRRK